MPKSDKKSSKRGKIEVKGVSITDRDYRGIIAIILCVGLIVQVAMENLQGAAIVGTLAGAAVSWYFSEKRSEGSGE